MKVFSSYKTSFLVVAMLCGAAQVYAQTDSLTTVKQDSLLEVQDEQKNTLLLQADSAHIADSLQQAALLQQIADLKSRDRRKKEELQARLDSLRLATVVRDSLIKVQVDSLRANTVGVPVVLYGDTLFNIYSKIGPFSPRERASSIVHKLERLVDENLFDPQKLFVFEAAESHDILHEDLAIMSVVNRDAFWLDKSREEVANHYAESMRQSIANYKESTGIIVNLKRTGLLVLTIVIFMLVVMYMSKGFTWLNKWLITKARKFIRGVKFKNYEFLSVAREEQVITLVLKVVKWIAIVFVLYLLLPIVFSIFPATKGIAHRLFGYILDPLKIFGMALVGYIPELITIVLIIVATRYFVRFLEFLSYEVASGKLVISGFYPDWAIPTFNLVRFAIYAFSFVVIFPYLPGSDSPIFKGVSVFIGVLFSLGSSSAISNIIAGLVITYMRAFKIGDRVRIGDTTGDVLDKTMLVTRLRTIKNEDVTIPNSAILNGSTTNYSSSAKKLGLILNSTVTIGYDVPWRKVHELLIGSALKTEFIKDEPQPFVLQTSLDDFYVSYQINAYTEEAGKAAKIYSDLHSHIQDAFNEAGVEIMSPHYKASRDGNMITIPPEFLPPGYKAPSFNVKLDKGQQD